MTTLIVTRHPGAVAWLQSRGVEGDIVSHLDPGQVGAGDRVYGVLPVHLIDECLRRGAEVFILQLPQIPPELRGKEITAEDMDRLGVKVYEVASLQLREVDLREGGGGE